MSMNLARGSVLLIQAADALGDSTVKWNKVSEHNRAEFNITPLRIENSKRMANGTLRKYWVADKRQMSLSWTMLPSYRTLTVDGAWGAEDLRAFYIANQGKSFDIRVNIAKDGTNQESSGYESYTVVFSGQPTFTLIKRGLQPFWNVSISLEEV